MPTTSPGMAGRRVGGGEEAIVRAQEREEPVRAGEDPDEVHEEAARVGVHELVDPVRDGVPVVLDVVAVRAEHQDGHEEEQPCSAYEPNVPQDQQHPLLIQRAPAPVDFVVPPVGEGVDELDQEAKSKTQAKKGQARLSQVGVTPAFWVAADLVLMNHDLNDVDGVGNVDTTRNEGESRNWKKFLEREKVASAPWNVKHSQNLQIM